MFNFYYGYRRPETDGLHVTSAISLHAPVNNVAAGSLCSLNILISGFLKSVLHVSYTKSIRQ